MNKKFTGAFFFFLILAILLSSFLYYYAINSAVLNPKGQIAWKELELINITILLMLIVVIPVLFITFFICLRYRASHKDSKYAPNWDHSVIAETVWWGFPLLIILVLSIITWISSHKLDPFRPIESTKTALTIQVVALQWKWLFIYPEEKIATVNFFQFPENVPLNFEITADAPMNSFWIPQLGGQIYAMPGMKTKLHLIADQTGSFRGSSANLSGEGFAGMTFIAKASSPTDYEGWVQNIKQSQLILDQDTYTSLAKPSEYNPEAFYLLKDDNLFNSIIMKYMMPPEQKSHEKHIADDPAIHIKQ